MKVKCVSCGLMFNDVIIDYLLSNGIIKEVDKDLSKRIWCDECAEEKYQEAKKLAFFTADDKDIEKLAFKQQSEVAK